MSRRLLAAVATAALTFGLAACGEGDDGPVTTAPPVINDGSELSDGGGDDAEPSDGGAVEEDSVEAAPDIPAPDPADYPGMDENTPEGAEQAFRYYWALAIWGYQTGDNSTLSALQTAGCANCDELVGQIDALRERGEYWSSTALDDIEMRTGNQYKNFDTSVIYSFVISSHVEPGKENGEVEEMGAVLYTAGGGLAWRDGQWLVMDLSSESSLYEEGQ